MFDRGIPSFHWDLAGGSLTETLWVIPGIPGVLVHYHWEGPTAQLRVTPLVAGRDHHRLQFEAPDALYPSSHGVAIRWHDRVWLANMPHARFHANPETFHDFFYLDEMRRGYSATEDLLSPGTFEVQCTSNQSVWFTFTEVGHGATSDLDPWACTRRERRRRHLLTKDALAAEPFIAHLSKGRSTIMAGFPWFADWGRDAFVALPGLAQALKQPALVQSVLDTFIESGVPVYTRWDETASTPHKVSADTNLWFIITAVQAILTGQIREVHKYLAVIDDILNAYIAGHMPGIRLEHDFLLTGDAPGYALTWMDAQIGEEVITPRAHKPIEVQALWYNALMLRDLLAHQTGQTRRYSRLCKAVRSSIDRQYPADYGLKDTLAPNDSALRPNQLYAVGLPYAAVASEHWPRIVKSVRQALYRPYGLLTLSADHPNFHPHYGLSVNERDHAYHQGMAWPYLLGIYHDAWLRVDPKVANSMLGPVRRWRQTHALEAGLGSISEIVEPDTGVPCGSPFQAWSVAEFARIVQTPR
jgi:predicted glycogen debranching enzyme